MRGLTTVLKGNSSIVGCWYTQLIDVEQEKNGIYTCVRRRKFVLYRLRETLGP